MKLFHIFNKNRRNYKIEFKSYINPNYILSNYIELSCNKPAIELIKSIADSKWNNIPNPLIVCCETGMGKSHLLQSAFTHTILKGKEYNPGYFPSHLFCSELVNAIKINKKDSFLKYCRNLDKLLIDDIDYFEKKDKTQEILIQIVDSFINLKKPIIFSSTINPVNLQLNPKLKTRLLGGLIINIEKPNQNDLLRFLSFKANQLEVLINNEFVTLFKSRSFTNFSEVEGMLLTYKNSLNKNLESCQKENQLHDII